MRSCGTGMVHLFLCILLLISSIQSERTTTPEQAQHLIALLLSNDTSARTARQTLGMALPPPATTYGIVPRYNSTTDSWGMFATRTIDPGAAVFAVNNETMLLRPSDCPELQMLEHSFGTNIHCTIPLSLCVWRRCKLDAQPPTNTSIDAMWSIWCRMLPEGTIAPVLRLDPNTDPTLSPYTRQRLHERHFVFDQVEQLARAAVQIWHAENLTNATGWSAEMAREFKWAQSMVIGRAWASPRFGCAAILILDLANHGRSGQKIVRVLHGNEEEVAWGFAAGTTKGLVKDEEFFGRYDDGDDCEVDLWLDYGFIGTGIQPRPCVKIMLEGSTIIIKHDTDIVVAKHLVQAFGTKVNEMLVDVQSSWAELTKQHEKEGGLLCGNDGAEEQDWAYKKRVVESERQLLTEIAAQMFEGRRRG